MGGIASRFSISMRASRARRFVIPKLSLLGLALAAPAADADPVCDGNACSVISASWDGARQKQIFHNASDRKVAVRVDGAWTGSTTMHLGPGQSQDCFFQAFRNPYHANYE
jgi:hypothetical protein